MLFWPPRCFCGQLRSAWLICAAAPTDSIAYGKGRICRCCIGPLYGINSRDGAILRSSIKMLITLTKAQPHGLSTGVYVNPRFPSTGPLYKQVFRLLPKGGAIPTRPSVLCDCVILKRSLSQPMAASESRSSPAPLSEPTTSPFPPGPSDQRFMTDTNKVFLNAVLATNSISVVACLFVLTAYFFLRRKYPQVMSRTSLKLSVAMACSDTIYHV